MRARRSGWSVCITALVIPLTTVPVSVFALPRGELPSALPKTGRPGEPGSGVPMDRAPGNPRPDRLRAPLPVRPRSEREANGVAQLEEILARYRAAHESIADTLRDQLIVQADLRRRVADRTYDQQIRDHAAKARKLRAQAVLRYEDFLKLHPADPTWTPEIMFRLAELHFEGANERLARQEEAFEKELEAYQEELKKNPDAKPPISPSPQYVESIALYREIVTRFPHYPYDDAALYMMGTLLFEQEEFDHSRQSYLALACASRFQPPLADGSNIAGDFQKGDYSDCRPWKENSRFAAEAWLRVGEVHYDFDELEAALEAYAQVAADRENDLYDEALIRMAWTQYLMRDFATAAGTFDTFVIYADAARGQGNIEGAVQLRDDGVKYLAKTYAEEDWDHDGRPDRVAGQARLDRDYGQRGQEPHVPEIYAALGDLYAERTDFQLAIGIWEETLRRWPLAAKAPGIQLRILAAYNMLQDKTGATRARDALATNYLRGTKWYYANEADPDAIEEAQKLAEEALVATALDHHQRAQALRGDGDPAAAKEEYSIAARAYEAYLARFPDTESSYEYRYNYAEALFYSGQHLVAAQQYAEVRDSNLDNRLQKDAAAGAVAAWRNYADDEQKSGRLVIPELPRKDSPGPFDRPKAIPAALQHLQLAYDRYVEVDPDGEQAGQHAYLAGEIAQRYHHFEDAEKRFAKVLADHCDENVSINAGKAIVDGYIAREDLKKTQEWTEKLMGMACGEGDEGTKFAGELKSLKNAVRFQEATLLYEAGEFEAAADRYVALVNDSPGDPNADGALNNAAVAYETIGRFASASQTYRRIYTDYPDSKFADDALVRAGFNHIRFFEFEEGIELYLKLAQEDRYKDSEHREIALWNAADLADNLQDYQKSAVLYRRFAGQTEDKAKAAEARFKAAEVTAKTGNQKETIKAFQEFVAAYGSAADQTGRSLEAHVRIGQAYEALGDRKKAEKYYRDSVALFSARGLQPASEEADFAAEAQFQLAEFVMRDYMAVELRSTGKRLETETIELRDKMLAAAKSYEQVATYKRADWALAAVYRIGYAFEQTAIKIREAPVPKQLKEYSEPWFAYKDIVGNAAVRFEESAIRSYRMTLDQAKVYGLANEWTRSATARLNIYLPDEYPLLRQPALGLDLGDRR